MPAADTAASIEALIAEARAYLVARRHPSAVGWRQRLFGWRASSIDPARLAGALRPAVQLLTVGGAAPGRAVAKLGGYPNALPDGGWPMVGRKPGWEDALPAPMSFVAQIDVAMVRGLHPDAAALPQEGWLLFFLDEFFSAEGACGDPHLRPCRVAHVASLPDAEGVRPPTLPHASCWSHHGIAGGGSDHYAAVAVLAAQAGLTLAPVEYETLQGPMGPAYEALEQRLTAARPDGGRHAMFGWPAAQSDLSDEAWRRLGCARWEQLADGDDPWVTLLQVDSTHPAARPGDAPPMLWHDGGVLLLLIRRSDLRAARWDRVVALVDG